MEPRILMTLCLLLLSCAGCRKVRYGPDGERIAFRRMGTEGDRLFCTTLDKKSVNMPRGYVSLLPPEVGKEILAFAVTDTQIELYWPENRRRTLASFDELVEQCNKFAAPDRYVAVHLFWSSEWPDDRRRQIQNVYERIIPKKYVSFWGGSKNDWLPMTVAGSKEPNPMPAEKPAREITGPELPPANPTPIHHVQQR